MFLEKPEFIEVKNLIYIIYNFIYLKEIVNLIISNFPEQLEKIDNSFFIKYLII